MVRGIAADSQATTLVVTTHRGTYRSTDGGMNWALEEDTLPVHLEAGSLTRDPRDPGILYVVYSLIPYPEVWRSALGGGNLLTRADPLSLIGGLAFLGLLLLGGIILIVWLSRWRRSNLGAHPMSITLQRRTTAQAPVAGDDRRSRGRHRGLHRFSYPVPRRAIRCISSSIPCEKPRRCQRPSPPARMAACGSAST